MDFSEEERLRAEAAAAEAQAAAARRQLAEGAADDQWQAGSREQAVVILHNSGFGWDDIVRFCRQRGLSDAEARALIRSAPLDLS